MNLAQWGPRHAREDRNVPRVPWTGQVRVRIDRKLHAARGIDLSERGIRVAGRFAVELGATIALTLDLFGQMVHAAGEITWVGVHDGAPAIGISLSVMRGPDRRRLANYVASHVYEDYPRSETKCPWDDGKTLPHGLNAMPPFIPTAPSYVPIRTGHTLPIRVSQVEAPRDEPGPSLERLPLFPR
jgi:hypothetical protein